MLTSTNEQARAGAMNASHAADPKPIGADERAAERDGIDLCVLPAGTRCVIDTSNSQYHIITLGRGSEVLVEGGKYFPQLVTAPLTGSVAGEHSLRPGWITVGRPMEIDEGMRRVVTSRVRAIRLADTGDAEPENPLP